MGKRGERKMKKHFTFNRANTLDRTIDFLVAQLGIKVNDEKCVWKSIYDFETKHKVAFSYYKETIKDCDKCKGYETKRSCYYNNKK